MDKKRVLLDSIKKLLELNVSEEEIIENMKDAGVGLPEARDLIVEAKKERAGKKAEEQESESEPVVSVEEKNPFEESEEQQVAEEETESPIDLPSFDEEEDIQPIEEEELPKFVEEKPKKVKGKSIERLPGDLWERGIITTINHKIDEIESIKDDIQKIIDKRIAVAVEKETRKIKVLLESQRKLMVSEVQKSLDEKERKLRYLDKTIKSNVDAATKTKGINEALLKEIQITFGGAKKRFSEIDSKLNKKLELETKITEGILSSAEKKVNSMLSGKDAFFRQKFEEKLRELEKLKEQIDPTEIQKNYDLILGKKVKEIDSLIAKKSKELDSQRFDSRIEELKLFQDQFIKVVEKNIKLLQQSKEEIKTEISKVDAEVKRKLSLVDKKMAELTSFEKTFAEEMGVLLEKAPKKKIKALKKKKA